jgi:hypothetical protein
MAGWQRRVSTRKVKNLKVWLFASAYGMIGPSEREAMKKLTTFIVGIVVGVISTFGAVIFGAVIYFQAHRPPKDDDILFAPKNFSDGNISNMRDELAYVGISGTLAGNGRRRGNNTYAITCYGKYRACFVSSVDQAGHQQIGRMDYLSDYPIVKWNDYEVVAQDEISSIHCFRTTITINRKGKTLLWVDEPTNQEKTYCKDADTNIRKYTIEDPPGWKH